MRLRAHDLALLLCFFAAGSAARESDRNQPLGVEADDADTVLADDGQTVLQGNVLITQGTLRIAAARGTVSRSGGDITRIEFEGQPATLQQENDNGALMIARAARIDYDVNAEKVVLTGNVEITHGGDELRGERITYDVKNGRMSGAGQGSGRVRMTIQPREKTGDGTTAEPGGR